MKEPVIVMLALLSGVAWQTAAHNVEAIMYVDTDMPCLRSELISGKVVVRNNGMADIKLLKGTPLWPNMFVSEQLHLFPDISVEDEERITARPVTRWYRRQTIKENSDYEVQNPRNEGVIATLKKGESLEIGFSGIEIPVPHGADNQRIPFAVELYLSPDQWIPIEVHPSIVVACDAKYTLVTANEKGSKWDNDAARVSRVQIGTNEFLWVKAKSSSFSQRLADLCPDDVVTHTDNTITITRKDGNVRTIPEKDIPRISAERKEEKRKNRPKE